MVTKRTPISRSRKVQITPAIVDLYRAALAEKEGDWTDGRISSADTTLHLALGRKLWQATVTSTIGEDEVPEYLRQQGADRVDDWINAHCIRLELDEKIATMEGQRT